MRRGMAVFALAGCLAFAVFAQTAPPPNAKSKPAPAASGATAQSTRPLALPPTIPADVSRVITQDPLFSGMPDGRSFSKRMSWVMVDPGGREVPPTGMTVEFEALGGGLFRIRGGMDHDIERRMAVDGYAVLGGLLQLQTGDNRVLAVQNSRGRMFPLRRGNSFSLEYIHQAAGSEATTTGLACSVKDKFDGRRFHPALRDEVFVLDCLMRNTTPRGSQDIRLMHVCSNVIGACVLSANREEGISGLPNFARGYSGKGSSGYTMRYMPVSLTIKD